MSSSKYFALVFSRMSREGGPDIEEPVGVFSTLDLISKAKNLYKAYQNDDYDRQTTDADFDIVENVIGVYCIQASYDYHGECQNEILEYVSSKEEAISRIKHHQKIHEDSEVGYTECFLDQVNCGGEWMKLKRDL